MSHNRKKHTECSNGIGRFGNFKVVPFNRFFPTYKTLVFVHIQIVHTFIRVNISKMFAFFVELLLRCEERKSFFPYISTLENGMSQSNVHEKAKKCEKTFLFMVETSTFSLASRSNRLAMLNKVTL